MNLDDKDVRIHAEKRDYGNEVWLSAELGSAGQPGHLRDMLLVIPKDKVPDIIKRAAVRIVRYFLFHNQKGPVIRPGLSLFS